MAASRCSATLLTCVLCLSTTTQAFSPSTTATQILQRTQLLSKNLAQPTWSGTLQQSIPIARAHPSKSTVCMQEGANGRLRFSSSFRNSGTPNRLKSRALLGAGGSVDDIHGTSGNLQPQKEAELEDSDIPALREIRSTSAGPTVWSEFSALAAETGAINLGQGFPNWDPPHFVVNAAYKAISDGFHQYTRTPGHPRLVKLLAKRYSSHFGREVDPWNQVAITVGASQALFVTFQAILSPGDEVVLLEPFFDLYLGQIKLAGGVSRHVPLVMKNGKFLVDLDAIRRVMSPKTRAIVINTPHNPTGKVFSKEELESIAAIVREYPRVLVISDEVYKYMVYTNVGADREPTKTNGHHVEMTGEGDAMEQNDMGREDRDTSSTSVVGDEHSTLPALRHVHFATLEGMWDRTITISSAGKTFSVTGWQVGWTLGPPRVIKEIQTILPYMQFCATTLMQEAMCTTLIAAERPYGGYSSYYAFLRHEYAGKRNRLEKALTAAGIQAVNGEGGFFLIGDVSKIKVPAEYLTASTPAMPVMTHGWAFCRWLAIEYGLIAIPTSPFFSAASREKGFGNGLVRFCFCKTEETLDAAAEALIRMAQAQPGAQGRTVMALKDGGIETGGTDVNISEVKSEVVAVSKVS